MFPVLVVPQLSFLYLGNQRGAFWVQMCSAVHTQWTTPLKFLIAKLLHFQLLILQWSIAMVY